MFLVRSRSKSITLDHGTSRHDSRYGNRQKAEVEGAAIEYDYEDLHIQIKRIEGEQPGDENADNNANITETASCLKHKVTKKDTDERRE